MNVDIYIKLVAWFLAGYANIVDSALVVLITLLLTVKFHFANKRAERGGKVIEGQAGFRYTL